MTRAERIERTLREVGSAMAAISYGMGYALESVTIGDEEINVLFGARDALELMNTHITDVLFNESDEEPG